MSISFAEIYQVNTTITLYSDLYNGSLQYQQPNQNVSTFITNRNNTIISSGTMTLQTLPSQNGTKWGFNTTLNQTGDYYRLTNYYSNSILLAQSSETFRVVTNINTIAQDTNDVVQTIFQTFIIFLVGFLIAVLAKWMKEPVFYFVSAVFFMGSSASLYFTGQGWTQPMLFALFGLVLFWRGIAEFIATVNADRKKKEENQFDEIE